MKSCPIKLLEKSFYLNQNRAGSCCKAYSDDFHANLPELLGKWGEERDAMAQGKEVLSCTQCWSDEALGKTSLRQHMQTVEVEHKIDVYVSNLCNHMCSYCSPKFSSLWETSIRDQGNFAGVSNSARINLVPVQEQTDYAQENFAQIVDYINSVEEDHSVVLSLLGGEPLMQYHSLRQVFDVDPNKIKRWVINSNLNPPSNRFLRQLIDRVDPARLVIHVSIDATPEYNHIPRHGFDPARFEENLALLQEHQIRYDFMAVTSVLGAFDLPQFVPWLEASGRNYSLQALSNPMALQIRHLPAEYKQQILAGIDITLLPQQLLWELQTPDSPRAHQIQQYHYVRQYLERAGQPQLPGLAGEWWQKNLEKNVTN